MRSFAALCLAAACGPRSASTTGAAAANATSPGGSVPGSRAGTLEVWSWFDLPDDPRSRELSGIVWDDATRTLWAVQDESANIVSLTPDPAFQVWTFGPVVALRMAFPLDLEALVVTRDGFIVASEKGPRVLEVDRRGNLRRDIPLPAHFANSRENKSLESLAMSPDGRYLFTTTEEALTSDGDLATLASGTRVRILRMSRNGADFTEHAYATDPLPYAPGDYGVADMAALSSEDLLVLERGWAVGSGNTARIYRISLAEPATSCLDARELTADTPVAKKRLVVDLAALAVHGLALPKTKQRQSSPLLDNYEGLSLGPRLPDGRQSLLLVSDDNARTDQFSRIVVLAVG